MSKPLEYWDAELERIILEHYRKSFREWWAKQCVITSSCGSESKGDCVNGSEMLPLTDTSSYSSTANVTPFPHTALKSAPT